MFRYLTVLMKCVVFHTINIDRSMLCIEMSSENNIKQSVQLSFCCSKLSGFLVTTCTF